MKTHKLKSSTKNEPALRKQKNLKLKRHSDIALKISIFNIFLNIILAGFKFLAGVLGNSYALVADGFHSLSDVFIGLIVLFGIKISKKPPDEKYEYGYGKVENISAILLSFILFCVSFFIGFQAIVSLKNKTYLSGAVPTTLALIVSVVSIIFKIFMFSITLIISKRTCLTSLKADAWHQLSDALSSLGIFVGIVGAILGLEIMDILASLLISLIILKVATSIFIDSAKKLTDHSAGKQVKEMIEKCLTLNFSNLILKSIKTKVSGSFIDLNIELFCSENLKLTEICSLTQKIKNKIFDLNLKIKICNVFILPKM